MLIGFIGFYRKWIPLYKDRIRSRWKDYLNKSPGPGEATKDEEEQLLKAQWIDTEDELLDEPKEAIFTTQTPCSQPKILPQNRLERKRSRGAVLLQAGCSEEEEEAALMREIEGGECEFEKSMTGLQLLPIAFISQ